MTLQGAGKEKKENEVKVAVVEVILQAENVLQPSVLVQAYNLLQVGFSFSRDQNIANLLSQEVKSLTVEDCEQSKCEVDPVKFAQTLAAKGGGQELRLVTLSPSTLLQRFV